MKKNLTNEQIRTARERDKVALIFMSDLISSGLSRKRMFSFPRIAYKLADAFLKEKLRDNTA